MNCLICKFIIIFDYSCVVKITKLTAVNNYFFNNSCKI